MIRVVVVVGVVERNSGIGWKYIDNDFLLVPILDTILPERHGLVVSPRRMPILVVVPVVVEHRLPAVAGLLFAMPQTIP